MRLFNNKSGSLPDKVWATFIFVGVIIVVIVFGYAWSITQPIIKDIGASSNYTTAAMDKLDPSAVTSWLDWAIVLVYFAINIVVCVILPIFVENNPVLFGLFGFVMFLLIFVNALLSNAIVDFIQGFAPSFTMTIFLLENFVVLEVVFLLIMIFMLFFKGHSTSLYYQ